jgi:uncharacterized damage-inducible protein DinB
VDRIALHELVVFTDYSWLVYDRALRPLGAELLTKPAPGSGWPALRDALVHINWAYMRWLAKPSATTKQDVPRIESWDELDAYRRQVRDHAREYLDSLSDPELLTRRKMNVDEAMLWYSPADIFAHVFLHERQHHGDLNTLMYQLGLEPPVVEFRFSLPQSQRDTR